MFDKKIKISTSAKAIMGDLFTPVGLYLKFRDQFRDCVLLESTDHNAGKNSFSFLAINPIAGIEVKNLHEIEVKFPNELPQKTSLQNINISDALQAFAQCFEGEVSDPKFQMAQGLYGYTSYDAVQFFDSPALKPQSPEVAIPLIRYRFYQYIIAINHFNDEMFLLENHIDGLETKAEDIERILFGADAQVFPYQNIEGESSNITDAEYLDMVHKAMQNCFRGDVFQLVVSRRFQQKFKGDEFNVYRALRHINPSPYLFFFDYGDYKLFGSSPESQLIVKNQQAVIHPIAGTFKRTGNDVQDAELSKILSADPKENAEHTMLVDLARNDLSRMGKNVRVSKLKEIHYFSHVIHMVSEVVADLKADDNPYEMMAKTFPQGTLSGAPKYKALGLIDGYEKDSRGYYGGCVGFVGFDNSCNQAIMIRSFLSKNNTLYYQAGAGVVAKSTPENELQEVNNKLNALKMAIIKAEEIK